MEIEIKIGREVEGNNILLVPSTCKKVSRRHATLHWKDGAVTIEDNESANGTYVNGKRIAKTKIGGNDTVWLGGNDGGEECYQLDVKKVFANCHEMEKKARTDFSKEFESIKQAYVDYQTEVMELKKRATMETQLPMKVLTFVPALLGLILFFVLGPSNPNRFLPTMIGPVISGLIGIFTFGKSATSNDRVNEDMMDLQIKYQPRYCCPKCGTKFPFTTHWKKLEADGKCPNPKCNAEFVKKRV